MGRIAEHTEPGRVLAAKTSRTGRSDGGRIHADRLRRPTSVRERRAPRRELWRSAVDVGLEGDGPMKRVRMETPKKREERWWLEVLPIDPLDQAVVRARTVAMRRCKSAPLGDVGRNP